MPVIFVNQEGFVTLTSYAPTAEQERAGITVEAIPDEENRTGQYGRLKYDQANGTLSYVYVDSQLTAEEKTAQLVEAKLKSKAAIYQDLDKTAATLEEVKAAKIEALKEQCRDAIYAGFTSGVNEFGFNEQDQSNFTQRMLTIVSGAVGPFQWKSKNNGVVELTADEFKQAVMDAEAHKLAQQQKYWTLEQQVIAATTKEEVNAVTW